MEVFTPTAYTSPAFKSQSPRIQSSDHELQRSCARQRPEHPHCHHVGHGARPSGSTGTPRKKGGFWLLDNEGKESFMRSAGLGIAVRPGHRVSLVYGAPSAQVDGVMFGAMNHTTGEVACDIMVLGQALRSWRLDVAEGKSFLIWAFAPCLALALLAFASPATRLDNRIFAAFWGAIGGFILGSVAWYFVGFRIGPQARLGELAAQINALGVAALQQAGD